MDAIVIEYEDRFIPFLSIAFILQEAVDDGRSKRIRMARTRLVESPNAQISVFAGMYIV